MNKLKNEINWNEFNFIKNIYSDYKYNTDLYFILNGFLIVFFLLGSFIFPIFFIDFNQQNINNIYAETVFYFMLILSLVILFLGFIIHRLLFSGFSKNKIINNLIVEQFIKKVDSLKNENIDVDVIEQINEKIKLLYKITRKDIQISGNHFLNDLKTLNHDLSLLERNENFINNKIINKILVDIYSKEDYNVIVSKAKIYSLDNIEIKDKINVYLSKHLKTLGLKYKEQELFNFIMNSDFMFNKLLRNIDALSYKLRDDNILKLIQNETENKSLSYIKSNIEKMLYNYDKNSLNNFIDIYQYLRDNKFLYNLIEDNFEKFSYNYIVYINK